MSRQSLEEIREEPAITKRLPEIEQDNVPEMQKKAKVLIGIDNSHECEKTFDWYSDYLHRPESEVLLVHVAYPPFVSTQQVMYMTGDHWAHIIGEEKNRVKLLEDKYATKMRSRGMTGRIKALFHQKIGEALVDVAKEEKITHVVLGSHGEDCKGRSVLGSVSDYVVNHVFCPVSIYRDEEMPPTTRRRSSLSSLIIGSIRRNSMK